MQLLLIQMLYHFADILRTLAGRDQQSVLCVDNHQILDPDHRHKLLRSMNIVALGVKRKDAITGNQVAVGRGCPGGMVLMQRSPGPKIVPAEIGWQADKYSNSVHPWPSAVPEPHSQR